MVESASLLLRRLGPVLGVAGSPRLEDHRLGLRHGLRAGAHGSEEGRGVDQEERPPDRVGAGEVLLDGHDKRRGQLLGGHRLAAVPGEERVDPGEVRRHADGLEKPQHPFGIPDTVRVGGLGRFHRSSSPCELWLSERRLCRFLTSQPTIVYEKSQYLC